MKKKTFKAQAIALVMVVLVVASIIGVSLFSRMSKEKQASIDEQESSVSLAQVDSVLDFFVGADIETIEAVLGATAEGEIEANTLGDVSTLLADTLGLGEDTVTLDEDWCIENQEAEQNYVRAKVEFSDITDFIEFQPGSVAAVNLQNVEPSNFAPGLCQLKVRMKAMEQNAVFVIKRVTNDSGDIAEDIYNYCIESGTASLCTSDIEDVEYASSFIDLSTWSSQGPDYGYDWDSENSAHSIIIDLTEEEADFTEELRILPIKGVLGINYELMQEGCINNKQFNAIKVTSEANCNDTYRGKQMFLPGSGTLGYSTLFDYGIYDSGLFQP
jgi:type II secretory pathway pseudopilin PulG